MKKTYISPATIVVLLVSKENVLVTISDSMGGEQLTKENVDDLGSSAGGGKNIWDEEW